MSSSKTKIKKLKIGFVFDDSLDKPDGVQQYITTLGDWLQRQGHEVRYLVGETRNHAHNPHIHSLARNFKVRFNKNNLSIPLPTNRRNLQKVLDDESFDILHVQLPCNPMFGSRVVRMAHPSTTIIGTFHIVGHSWLERTGSKMLGKLQRRTLRRFDHIISVSTAAADFAKHFGIQTDTILPNVITMSRFENAKKIKHLSKGKLVIVFLGRLVERKGCRYLIEAIHRLSDRGVADKLQVLICGKGPQEAKLRQMVRSYKLGNVVQFVGFVAEEDKPDYLTSADLAIFPSTGGESFGIVLLEAMASESGVVMGGNNVGYRTVLGEQANHVLFDPRDTQVFADKIQLLMDNSALRGKLHNWQNATIRQYDVDEVGPELLKIYTQ